MIPYFEFSRIWLGPIPLQVWGVFVALGIVLGMIILERHLKNDLLLPTAFWLLIGGFIGARFGHVLLYNPQFFLREPLEILKVWHGGLSSFGGFIGAGLTCWFLAKKHDWQKKDLLIFGDSFMFAAIYGWMVARVGCVMIHDHLGTPCNCFLAFTLPDQPRLDMAFIEIIGLMPLALLFFFMRKRGVWRGWFVSVGFTYYGLLRFILDFFRARDIANADVRYFSLTPGQYFAMVMVSIGIIFWYKTKHGRIA